MKYASLTCTMAAVACAVIASAAAFAQTQAGTYSCDFTFFSVNGSSFLDGTGINRSGTVVGHYFNGPTAVGFLRRADGTLKSYSAPGAAQGTWLQGINDKGAIVGSDEVTLIKGHGFLIGPDGTFTSIDVPNSNSTAALGINNHGDIVGDYAVAGKGSGFLLSGGQFSTLTVANALSTTASDINDSGVIAGNYTSPDLTGHGFLLNQGQYTTIDYPGAADSALTGINDHKAAAGYYVLNSGQLGGFVYKGGAFANVVIPNTTSITTDGINLNGDITGSVTTSSGQQQGYVGTNCR
ncbi:MAG TPA: hypothetical protein VFA89_03095 [Terriglobales bacterium]|nr:hypothetical protein [Terriglobales bacterium]